MVQRATRGEQTVFSRKSFSPRSFSPRSWYFQGLEGTLAGHIFALLLPAYPTVVAREMLATPEARQFCSYVLSKLPALTVMLDNANLTSGASRERPGVTLLKETYYSEPRYTFSGTFV